MSLIQSLLRRLFAKSTSTAGLPTLLQAEQLKSVVGGNGDAPRSYW